MKLKDSNTLVSVRPPRLSEGEISGTVHLMEALRGENPFALELAYVNDTLSLMVRSSFGSEVRRSVAAHLGGYELSVVSSDSDPMVIRKDEIIFTRTLVFEGPIYAPIRTVDAAAVGRGDFDPLSGVVGSLVESVRPGERLVVRLVLKRLDEAWRADVSAELLERERERQRLPEIQERGGGPADRHNGSTVGPIVLLAIAIAAAGLLSGGDLLSGVLSTIVGWMRMPFFALWPVIAIGMGLVVAGLVWAGSRTRSADEPEHIDPDVARQRLDWAGFKAELQVHAVVPEGDSSERRARELSWQVASAYDLYSTPWGARVVESWTSTDRPTAADLVSLEERVWKPLVAVFKRLARRTPPISSLEAASLWHPLHPHSDRDRVMPRMRYRPIAPSGPVSDHGVLFGVTTGGSPQLARFSPEAMSVHHVYLGGTRMGKSTLMLHNIVQRMRAKAQGKDEAALVVVDPHSDLVSAVLEQVPRALRDRVWLIDLSSKDWVPAINLLDTRLFPGRDLTCDGIARVAHGIWREYWGPRMQNVMSYMAKALYEANLVRRREDQYTILDARLMLTDKDFRQEVLRQVGDPAIVHWWLEDFDRMPPVERSGNTAAIRSRLDQFAASEKVGEIFGQSASTVPLSIAVANGDIILVDTAPSSVGREVANLMGASVLNLIDSLVRRSGQVEADRRRPLMVVIDEAQTIPGVAYDEMLGEAAKFGATFVLATQSLAKLDQLSPSGNMRTNLMANAGCVAVFSCEYGDSEFLVAQMGREFVTPDDVRGLPSHHAYIQSRAGGENPPPYSVRLLWPDPGDRDMADLIRRDCRFYTLPADVAGSRAKAGVEARISGALTKLRSPRLAD